jgi:hypothetical protein
VPLAGPAGSFQARLVMKVSTLPAKSLALSDAAMAEMRGRVEAAPTTANSWCGFAVAAASDWPERHTLELLGG